MLAGSSTERIIVASISTATPRPTPNCCMPTSRIRAKVPKTPTMMAAALVICPASSCQPDSYRHRLVISVPLVIDFLDPVQQQHVVVHGKAEQDGEQEQG